MTMSLYGALRNEAAEEALVAGLMLDPNWPPEVFAECRPEDFFDEYLARVYESCERVAERGDPILVTTVIHDLLNRGLLDRAPYEGLTEERLIALLNRHTLDVVTFFPAVNARIVHDLGERRRKVTAAEGLLVEALGNEHPRGSRTGEMPS